MKQLIVSYENEIKAISDREAELRAQVRRKLPASEHDRLLDRIDLLIAERYELMHALSMMRRFTGPKLPSPSLGSRDGDAAC